MFAALFTPLAPISASDAAAPEVSFTLRATLPHDIDAFTQGLAFDGETLLEGTGRNGQSVLRRVDPASGRVLAERRLPDAWFGEGVAVAAGEILQLTWRSGIARRWTATLEPRGSFRYEGEGWGLTHDGRHWVMGDGSDRLAFRDPADFRVLRTIAVRDGDRPVRRLNELEFARGAVFANVWGEDRIAVIDPADGRVRAWLDLSPLREHLVPPPGWNPREHVLNGIAWHPARDRFFVTGKCWPALFEIEVGPLP